MLARIACLLLLLDYGFTLGTKGDLATLEGGRMKRGLRNRAPFRPGPPPSGGPLHRGQHLAQQRPLSPADQGPFPEMYLRQNLRHGDTAVVEEVQQPVPFNVTDNGDRIIKDQPMVERRSIPQFGGMVTLYTRTNPIRLLYYGNWCGSGGMGDTLDGIDHCCMEHDMCYGEVEKFPCNLPLQKPYVVHYAWRWDDKRKQAYCLRTGDRCGDRTCECDRVAAACFSQYMIDGKLEWNRLRKNRIIKGTKRPYVDDLHFNYRH